MLRRQFTIYRTIIVITILALALPACGDLGLYWKGPQDFGDGGTYAINPNTILIDLKQGKTNVFTPKANPDDFTVLPSGTFNWRQSDYLKIVVALYQFVWKETPESWDIAILNFESDCHENSGSFDNAEFLYFKTVVVNGKQVYMTRGIGIYPLSGEVTWSGGRTYPRPLIFGWQKIDLGGFKATADDAMQIAELNGGKTARLILNDKCSILIVAKPDTWNISYMNSYKIVFSIHVNTHDNGFDVLNTQ